MNDKKLEDDIIGFLLNSKEYLKETNSEIDGLIYNIDWLLGKMAEESLRKDVQLSTFDWITRMCSNMTAGTVSVPALVERYVPEIHRVIYSPPATIIIWADKTKTVVKCSDGDEYSRTTGLALCIIKKVYGAKKYREILKKHLTE